MESNKLHLLVLAALASPGSCALGASPMTKAPIPTPVGLNRLNQTVGKVAADGNSTGSCVANCTFVLNQTQPTLYSWSELSFTATSTAATLYYIVDKEANQTSTQLVPNTDLPPNYAPPKVNSDGFRFEEVSMHTGVVPVAYPTSFIDWGSDYRWSGVLMTKTASPGSTDTCVTQTAEVAVALTSNPQPTDAIGTAAPGDPKGLRFALVPQKDPKLRNRFAYLFKPDHIAFESCSAIPDPQEHQIPPTVAWVTHTTTSIVGSPGVPPVPQTGTLNLGSSIAGAPHVPAVTESPQPVQGGQVVHQSNGPLSIIDGQAAHGASVVAGNVPSSVTGKATSPSKSGSAKQGTVQEASAIRVVAGSSVLGLAGLAVFAGCNLWV